MKITVEAEPKEIADLVLAVQDRQGKTIKTAFKIALSKFCDEFDLHDEEITKALSSLME